MLDDVLFPASRDQCEYVGLFSYYLSFFLLQRLVASRSIRPD